MSAPSHSHAPSSHQHHDHAPAGRALPLTILAQSALVRLGIVFIALALLWLGVWWAVALP